ncbi:hypothetical protein GN958_ATG00330 [Phytophthora infestans]|uniref:Uncharacterized protein n=1 Tax=Phytophthora infestans TaxID=4787 RepID=A0A8S9VIH1_PHYIN|nr:hypothetical protein GN958_ATG00330 [Phytophthora infestans]
MVLTRAQVRAQATAQQQEIPEAAIVVVDHSDETAVAEVVAERSTVELVRHGQDYLAKLAEPSLKGTHLCEGQGEAQSSALLAVRESIDAGIKQLANQQLAIAGRFHEELMATHAGIREQFLRLETMQANVSEKIERSVADKLFRALREAHSESQSMIAAQVDDGTSHDAVKSFVLEEIEKSKRHFEAQKRMELVQRQLLTAHPQTGRCTEISDIKVEHGVAGEVGQRLTEVRIDDISEQTKQTVENSVKLIHDLVREAIRRYACVSGDTGDGSGDVGDDDDKDLSKEDRSIRLRMRDALVKAHASAFPSQLKVEAEDENPQLSEVKSSRNDEDIASPSRVLPLAYRCELNSNGNAGRRAVIADVQKGCTESGGCSETLQINAQAALGC